MASPVYAGAENDAVHHCRFGAGGINFPIGVLIYWTTTNLWTMGQASSFVIRRICGVPRRKGPRQWRAAQASGRFWAARRPTPESGSSDGRCACRGRVRSALSHNVKNRKKK